jgi:hypothetical protein
MQRMYAILFQNVSILTLMIEKIKRAKRPISDDDFSSIIKCQDVKKYNTNEVYLLFHLILLQ